MADGHVITPGVVDAGTEDVHVVIMLNSGAVRHQLEAVNAVLDKPYLQLAADAILVKTDGLHFERTRSALAIKISVDIERDRGLRCGRIGKFIVYNTAPIGEVKVSSG